MIILKCNFTEKKLDLQALFLIERSRLNGLHKGKAQSQLSLSRSSRQQE